MQEEPQKGINRPEFYSVTTPQTMKKQNTLQLDQNTTNQKNQIKTVGVSEKAISNNAPQPKYDVFVSFRGEGIRHGFLGHLIKAFPLKQINAFVDGKTYNSSLVQIWRDALKKSANLSGITSSNFRNDAELLEEIINLLLMRLSKY
ncbi:disease resistance protein RPV1 [Trifolium repens]|nr:disease resistance protein RPV1 [Trifolium repens]